MGDSQRSWGLICSRRQHPYLVVALELGALPLRMWTENCQLRCTSRALWGLNWPSLAAPVLGKVTSDPAVF